MNTQRWLALALLITVIAIAVSSPVWLAQLSEDDEEPTATPSAPTPGIIDLQADSGEAVSAAQAFPTQDPVISSLMSDIGMDSIAVGDEPFVIMAGDFTVIDDLRRASGTASIYRIGDVTHALRLEPFEIAGGPDLHVILSLADNPRTSSETLLPTHVDLGALKSIEGAQNYEIPNSVVVTRYKSVVIYSMSLNLVYSTASLTQVRG